MNRGRTEKSAHVWPVTNIIQGSLSAPLPKKRLRYYQVGLGVETTVS